MSDFTKAVVATAVEVSPGDWVVAVAEPRATVLVNVTPPANVYVPNAECVPVSARNEPGPEIGRTVVAVPPAPPVPKP